MSEHQPECTCDARPGTRHAAGCAALTPPAPRSREERAFDQAWQQADPGQFGSSGDRG